MSVVISQSGDDHLSFLCGACACVYHFQIQQCCNFDKRKKNYVFKLKLDQSIQATIHSAITQIINKPEKPQCLKKSCIVIPVQWSQKSFHR